MVLVSDVTSPTSIGLLVAEELAPLDPMLALALALALPVLAPPAALELDVLLELQALALMTIATIVARDATLARLAGNQVLRDFTRFPFQSTRPVLTGQGTPDNECRSPSEHMVISCGSVCDRVSHGVNGNVAETFIRHAPSAAPGPARTRGRGWCC